MVAAVKAAAAAGAPYDIVLMDLIMVRVRACVRACVCARVRAVCGWGGGVIHSIVFKPNHRTVHKRARTHTHTHRHSRANTCEHCVTQKSHTNGVRVLAHGSHIIDVSLVCRARQARMNGDTALAALRAAGCGVPVAAVTANVTPGDVERYEAQGFAGTLGKPFTGDAMHGLLASMLCPGE